MRVDALQAIYARRSIRKFEDRPVDPGTLEELVRLAMAAPSAHNQCPWEFVIVSEKEGMDALRAIMRFGRYNAPSAIIVCGNMERSLPLHLSEFWVQDCSAAMENILVAAAAMGLGSVWLGAHPVKVMTRKLAAEFGLPSCVIPLGVVYIGYPAEQKDPRSQYRADQVHWQRMGERREMPDDSRETGARKPMDVREAILTRRSIRKYTAESLSDDEIGYLLEAGFCAPTARNTRPWHFVVIRQRATLETIAKLHPHAAMLPQAGCAIAVCGDRERQPEDGYLALDCAAAIQNMLLAAHGSGLGAVWLGIYPRPERVEGLREILSIPESVLPVGLIAVGRPAEEKTAVRRTEAACVHAEKW